MPRINRYHHRRHTIFFEIVLLALFIVGMGSAGLAVNILSSTSNVRAVSEFAIAAALSLGFLVNAIVLSRRAESPAVARKWRLQQDDEV